MNASQYVARIDIALRSNRREWFPMDPFRRKEQNLRLAREVGYGLAIFCDWLDIAKGLYGRLIVVNSLDSVGVVVNNAEWINSIREGVAKFKGRI